jgi:hypothetical protein
VATVFNTTAELELRTSFPMVDYGNSIYFCFYGVKGGDVYQYMKPATLINSLFTCNISSETIVDFEVSIWMETFGIKKIISNSEDFRFIGISFLFII